MNPMQAPNVGVGGKDHGKRFEQAPVCVVSKHPSGFWMADVYIDGETDSAPDWYCTGNLTVNHQEAIELAHMKQNESNLARCYIRLHSRYLDQQPQVDQQGIQEPKP